MLLGIVSATAFGQTAGQAQSGGGGMGSMLGQKFGMGGKGGITIQMTSAVDSNAGGAGRAFPASVVSATSIGGVSIPQGSPAVATLTQNGNSWTISLTAVSANGQVIPVTSSMANVAGGGAMGSVTSMLNGGGFSNPFSKSKAQPASPNSPKIAASGTRVYLPANTNVTFLVSPKNPPTNSAANQSPAPAFSNQTASNQVGSNQVSSNQVGSNQATLNQPALNQASAVNTNPTAMQPTQLNAADPQPMSSGSSTVVFKGIQYQLSGCHREAPHIVCELQVMNLGAVDAALLGDPRTYFIDQSGNKGGIQSASIANCQLGRCDMLPQIPMKARYIFGDETGESKNLVRLQLWAGGAAVAQFTNVPVQ